MTHKSGVSRPQIEDHRHEMGRLKLTGDGIKRMYRKSDVCEHDLGRVLNCPAILEQDVLARVLFQDGNRNGNLNLPTGNFLQVVQPSRFIACAFLPQRNVLQEQEE